MNDDTILSSGYYLQLKSPAVVTSNYRPA